MDVYIRLGKRSLLDGASEQRNILEVTARRGSVHRGGASQRNTKQRQNDDVPNRAEHGSVEIPYQRLREAIQLHPVP